MGWKRSEMKIHKDGYYDLAAAVMRQWNQDGRPRGDEVGVKLWADLLKSHQKVMMCGMRQGTLHEPPRRTINGY